MQAKGNQPVVLTRKTLSLWLPQGDRNPVKLDTQKIETPHSTCIQCEGSIQQGGYPTRGLDTSSLDTKGIETPPVDTQQGDRTPGLDAKGIETPLKGIETPQTQT